VENSNTKKFLKIAIFVFVISIFVLFALLMLSRKEIYVQIGTPPNGISHMTFSIFFMIVAIASLVYLCNDRVIKGIVIGVGIFFIIVPSFPKLLIGADYTNFSSPDNKEKFVVIERGYGQVYQLSDSGLYMKYLTSIDTKRGYKPFLDGAYQLKWEEPNCLIIHYAFRYTSDSLDKEISIQYKAKRNNN